MPTVAPDETATRPLAGRPAATVALLALDLVLCLTSILFAPAGSTVAAWWPAAGVASALVVLSPPRSWPVVVGAVAAVTALANVIGGRDLAVAGCFGIANAAEALVVALVLRAHRRRPWLRAVEDVPRLLLAAAVGAGTVGLLAAATVTVATGADFLPSWWTVTAAHGAAILAVLPLVLLVDDPTRGSLRQRLLNPYAALQLTATLAVGALVFHSGQSLPLTFLPLPFVVWGAFVLCPRGLAVEVLVVGALVTLTTGAGWGPFAATGLSVQRTESLVQLYLVVLVLATLPLSLTVAQRRMALEQAVAGQVTLQRERDLTAAVLEATVGTAIIGTDPDGTVLIFGRGAEQLLGRPAEEVVGRLTAAAFHDHDELVERGRELGVLPGPEVMTAVPRATGRPERRDWTLVRADGSTIRVSMTVTVVPHAGPGEVAYVSVAQDVTERRRAEAAVRQALAQEQEAVERLQQLDRAKSEFVASVSHELRTPMTAVLGFTQLLGNGTAGPLTEPQRRIVDRLDRSGRRLLGLIENLLTLSRIEAGQATVADEPVDVAEVLVGAVDATDELLKDRDLDVAVDLPEAPRAVVNGDAEQLERAVVNLLSNAIKFTPDGGRVRLGLSVTERTAVVTVADTGVGIPEDEQGQLFERFFRASTATRDAIPGTGLGLAIVRSIVEAHGGTVTVRSAADHGTTFVVTLPLAG